MNWKINIDGQYESELFIIEQLPSRNAEKPFFLYQKTGKQGWLNFIRNYADIDAAKFAAARLP